jgi:hypothetical protein
MEGFEAANVVELLWALQQLGATPSAAWLDGACSQASGGGGGGSRQGGEGGA